MLIFLIVFVPASLLIASRVAAKGDRQFLIKCVVFAWVLQSFIVAFMNNWRPFAGGGDDMNYFNLADVPIQNVSDALDLTRFIGYIEQPGYPWMLSLLNALTGHDLLVFKFLNLFFLILLALTWYRIGLILESQQFARQMMLGILFLTPQWYYIFFLLKDMSISLLQSIFMLAAIQLWVSTRVRPIITAVLSSLVLLPFRTTLIVQNAAVLLGSFIIKAFGRRVRGNRLMPLLLGLLIFGVSLPLVTNPDVMIFFGIYTSDRVIGTEEWLGTGDRIGPSSEINRILFPLEYLLIETSGLSPNAWSRFDSIWLRGVLAIPWIFLLLPFFFKGLHWLFRTPDGVRPAQGLVLRFQQSRVVTSPWSLVLFFILVSVSISWTVGTSTRWRLADMPMMAAIAMAGWTYTRPKLRKQLLFLWIGCSGILFALFYLING